jgi:hypothetical protein
MTAGQRWAHVVVALSILATGASAQEPTSWETFDFVHGRVDSAGIDHLSLLALRELRGIVFGKHGRMFKDPHLQSYFASQEWYHPDPKFSPQLIDATRAEERRLYLRLRGTSEGRTALHRRVIKLDESPA